MVDVFGGHGDEVSVELVPEDFPEADFLVDGLDGRSLNDLDKGAGEGISG